MDCIFCKIISKELSSQIVYEDDATVAFLDIHPINPGHTLVIPKVHTENLLDTSVETLHAMMTTTQKVAKGVLTATGATGFNFGVNNGSVAGQVVFHLHFHIMPRFPGDGFELWHGKSYGEGEAEMFASKIREAL